MGLQCAQNHLATVAGRNQQRPLFQARQIILHLHGDDHVIVCQTVQMLFAIQHRRPQIVGNFFDRRTAQQWVSGNDGDFDVVISQFDGQCFLNFLYAVGIGAIGDHANDGAAFGAKRFDGGVDGAQQFVHAVTSGVGDDDDRPTQAAGDGDVHPKFKRAAVVQ